MHRILDSKFSDLFLFGSFEITSNELHRDKTGFLHMRKTKTQINFAVTAKLISVFVLAILIVQSLCFLNPKFQASSRLLWLHSLLCVGPGRKPQRPVFSQQGSNKVRRRD